MDSFPRQKLNEIINQYGTAMIDDPRRLESLLTYLCGDDNKLEIHLIVGAQREYVAKELANTPKGMPVDALIDSLTIRLEDNLGLTREAAAWAVESWAECLGLKQPEQPAPDSETPLPVDWKTHAWRLWWSIKSFPAYIIYQSRLAWALTVDSRVPVPYKLIPIFTVAYIVSPISLIVDLIPVAGWLANLAVYMLGLAMFTSVVPAEIVHEHAARLRRAQYAKQTENIVGSQAEKTKNRS